MSYAIISGLCASLASLFGKLSGLPMWEEYFIARILFFVLMLCANATVWNFYVKALHAQNSTITATVASTGSNYIFSAIFGFVLFGETTSFLWWTGMFLILQGLVLVTRNEDETKILQEAKKKT